jgi:hypothetical protein
LSLIQIVPVLLLAVGVSAGCSGGGSGTTSNPAPTVGTRSPTSADPTHLQLSSDDRISFSLGCHSAKVEAAQLPQHQHRAIGIAKFGAGSFRKAKDLTVRGLAPLLKTDLDRPAAVAKVLLVCRDNNGFVG